MKILLIVGTGTRIGYKVISVLDNAKQSVKTSK